MMGCDHKAVIIDKEVKDIVSTKFAIECIENRYKNTEYIIVDIDMDNYTRYQHGAKLYYEKEKGFYYD